MKCDQAMNTFLELDKGDFVPLSVALHLLFCPSCRKEIFKFRNIEQEALNELEDKAVPFSDDDNDPLISSILKKTSSLNTYPIPDTKNPFLPWILVGLAMVLSFSIFSSLPLGMWGLVSLGKAFILPLYIVFGCVIAIYSGLFIATHLDFFIKKYNLTEESKTN